MYTATERLYLDAEGKVVKADDPNRTSLLVAAGGSLTDAEARRYGLLDAPEAKAAEPKVNKSIGKAPANKAKE